MTPMKCLYRSVNCGHRTCISLMFGSLFVFTFSIWILWSSWQNGQYLQSALCDVKYKWNGTFTSFFLCNCSCFILSESFYLDWMYLCFIYNARITDVLMTLISVTCQNQTFIYIHDNSYFNKGIKVLLSYGYNVCNKCWTKPFKNQAFNYLGEPADQVTLHQYQVQS